jgi:hypothetical protein
MSCNAVNYAFIALLVIQPLVAFPWIVMLACKLDGARK